MSLARPPLSFSCIYSPNCSWGMCQYHLLDSPAKLSLWIGTFKTRSNAAVFLSLSISIFGVHIPMAFSHDTQAVSCRNCSSFLPCLLLFPCLGQDLFVCKRPVAPDLDSHFPWTILFLYTSPSPELLSTPSNIGIPHPVLCRFQLLPPFFSPPL